MHIREAVIGDVPQIQVVRNAVKENTLSDPNLVTDSDCITFITARGKGWVCETGQRIVGFSIVDLVENNVWALFVHPDFEKMGIRRRLHDILLEWYFQQKKDTVWLGTVYDTRAEGFYRAAGWKDAGTNGPKERRFEMTYEDWAHRSLR